jgi:hypothetical protein
MTMRWIAQASAKGRRAVDYLFGYLHMEVSGHPPGGVLFFRTARFFPRLFFIFLESEHA